MTGASSTKVIKGRGVPPAGSIRRPWPWKLWVALIFTFVAALAVHFAFQPRLAISTATLSFPKDHWGVDFRVSNHSSEPLSAELFVIVGHTRPGSKYRSPSYTELSRNTLAVSLAPKESKDVTSVFPANDELSPTTVRVEINALR